MSSQTILYEIMEERSTTVKTIDDNVAKLSWWDARQSICFDPTADEQIGSAMPLFIVFLPW